MSAWEPDRLRDDLNAWVVATTRVVADTLKRLVEHDTSDEVRAEAFQRESMAAAARLADALDADDDAWTNRVAADHVRVLGMTLEMAADTLAPEHDEVAVPLDQLATDADLARCRGVAAPA